jgi:hypothetical protein
MDASTAGSAVAAMDPAVAAAAVCAMDVSEAQVVLNAAPKVERCRLNR